ncbi:hypothetical protein MMC32_005389 [Xylographa parallela]|nr:hypothetical protein [Xylographa parallela]
MSIIAASVPFTESCALNTEHLAPSHTGQHQPSLPHKITSFIPGNPSIGLGRGDVNLYLSADLETQLLDELYDRLWLVARKSGNSIDALHVQKIRGRTIIPCEDPRLHLVWQYGKIYIKPIPAYLLNHEFWSTYLCLPSSLASNATEVSTELATLTTNRSVAIGFLRSYAFLIKHQLDFIFAKEAHLIPPELHELDWISWSKFMDSFRCIEDEQVAKRYHYGQLRLSRLNWVVRLFQPQHASTSWFYEIPHWSIIEYITQATIPLLFLFASVSLVLSSMQVALSVPAGVLWFRSPDRVGLFHMSRAFWVFSVATLVLSAVIWSLLFCIPLLGLLRQLIWGFRKERERAQAVAKFKV